MLKYRGYPVSEHGFREFEKVLGRGEQISCFGREVIEGFCSSKITEDGEREAVETVLFEEERCVALGPYEEITMTSNGQVAIIINGPLPHIPLISSLGGQVLEIYPSINALVPSSTIPPLLKLSSKPRSLDQKPNSRTFTSLSAGDAHFSFIVNYQWHSPEHNIAQSNLIAESYYNRIWSIRTDKRSFNDDAWIPLEEELRGLEEEIFFTVEGTDVISTTLRPEDDETGSFGEKLEGNGGVEIRTERLGLFCAEDNDSRDLDFTICKSNGWITIGLATGTQSDSSQDPRPDDSPPPFTSLTSLAVGKAYLLPFSRAQSTIPALRTGEIAFHGIADIHCGSEHVMVRLSNGEVWSLGNNIFGQRGIQRGGEGLLGWRKVEVERMGRVRGIICGKWNSFFIVEGSHGDIE